MVPRPLEQDPSGLDRQESPAAPGRPQGGFGRRIFPAGPAADAPGAGVSLDQVALRIEDGLLMALGPDGDPIPPAVFVAAAQEQPEARVRLGDGEVVAPLRAAAVLEAQAKGAMAEAAEGAAADGWLRSMLGLGPQPDMAPDDQLRSEQGGCELTAFARELMISMPAGGAFLLAEAADRPAAAARLLLADGEPVSVSRLIERIRTEIGRRQPAPDPRVAAAAAEMALPECGIWAAGDAVVLELPSIGSVRLTELQDTGSEAPRVSIFLASGEPAGVAQLVATLGGARRPGGPDEAPPARQPAAGDTMVLSLDWPAFIEAAADGTADLGVLAEALDRSRAVLPSVTVAGLPTEASLSAGRRLHDGSWRLVAEDLRGLTLRLPAEVRSDIALEITVRSLQGEAVRTLAVRRPGPEEAVPSAAAGEPTATAPAALGAPIRLAVRPPAGAGFAPKDAALVIIGGVPQGGLLSAGIDNGDGSWMLSTPDLVGLELSLPAGCTTDITLEVKALAVTSREGEIASAADRLRLSLDPAAPPLPLVIDRAAVDGLQALMIRDLPQGARLSAGTYDPAIDAWVVLPRQLDGLSVMAGGAAGFTLTVLGIARGADGRAASRLVTRLTIGTA